MEPTESTRTSQYCLQYGITYSPYPKDMSPYMYRPVGYLHTTEGSGLKEDRVIRATLQNEELWKKFAQVGNEMLVTKAGRHFFPPLLIILHGLDPRKSYNVSLRVLLVDNQRYRYINMKWHTMGDSKAIQNKERQVFHHSSSPNTGQFWMNSPISFNNIKITHYPHSPFGNILLNTMHKYTMEIIITCTDGSKPTVIPLESTSFIAVSAYQNQELIKLKINNNPCANAFKHQQNKNAAAEEMASKAEDIPPQDDMSVSMLSSPIPPIFNGTGGTHPYQLNNGGSCSYRENGGGHGVHPYHGNGGVCSYQAIAGGGGISPYQENGGASPYHSYRENDGGVVGTHPYQKDGAGILSYQDGSPVTHTNDGGAHPYQGDLTHVRSYQGGNGGSGGIHQYQLYGSYHEKGKMDRSDYQSLPETK